VNQMVQDPDVARLSKAFFEKQRDANYRRMDRVFAVLMGVQWVAGTIVALLISPKTYAGASASIHPHVFQAIIGGGLLSSLPIALALLRPGKASTRQVICGAQMLWSALLIHLTGGRIETHFHVFGSLAFVAFYRDWKLLPTATVVVAADHLLRGLLAPASVYGIANPEWWRFLEHAFWVTFEDVVLMMSCIHGVGEMKDNALRRAEAEVLSHTLDRRVQERTEQLTSANAQLTESIKRQQEAQQQLIEASRKAGMADVATAVLHNVGNVLNSVNVSSGVVTDTLRQSQTSAVAKVAQLVSQPDVVTLLASHPKAKHVAPYLTQVSSAIAEEQGEMLRELDSLQRNVEHIKVIVSMQQTHAKGVHGMVEPLSLAQLLDDAVTMNSLSCEKDGVEIQRDYAAVPEVMVDRHKVFQIVLNLLTNARHAVKDTGKAGRITLRLRGEGPMARLEVEDNGCGISAENMKRMFNHGFTTKKEGHGFGLHSSACNAREMGGDLTCQSDGEDRGATFVLALPLYVAKAAA